MVIRFQNEALITHILYTHSFNVKAGTTTEMYDKDGLRYAVCEGMTGFSKDITDYADGTYRCPEPSGMYR